MSAAVRISRPVAVAAVLLCLWLLGVLGFSVMFRLTGPWLFPPTDDFWLAVMMLGGFYGARVASMIPALCVASIVIAHSRFTRPYHAFTGLVGGSYLLGLLLRWVLKRPAWESVTEAGPVMAFIFELLSALALAAVGVLFLYLYRRLSRRSHEIVKDGRPGAP